MKNIQGAIFDVDGTLLDSMEIWDNAAANYLISMGASPRPGLNEELRDLGGHEIPLYFKKKYGISKTETEIQNGIYQTLHDSYINNAPLKEGALDVLNLFRDRKINICVATATDRHLVEPALRRCGIYDYFSRIFTCGEERTSKSSSEIYIRAAKHLGSEISQTLVFEDALYAVKSAADAGFKVIGVYDSGEQDYQDEISKLCHRYYKVISEFIHDFM